MSQKQPLYADIKQRMQQHISSLWGIKNTDALDPLIKIMIEALSGEMERVYHDIGNYEKRLLEKMANLMTPGVLFSPYCASSLMNARPVEHMHTVTPETHFCTPKKTGNKEDTFDIFFTPLFSTKLFDGKVSYFAVNNKIFIQKNPLQKVLFLEGKNNISNNNKNLWIGIKLNPEIKEINNLSFHFNLAKSYKISIATLFQSATAYINNQEINISSGLQFQNANENQNALFAQLDPMSLMENEIHHLYTDEFLTLRDQEKKFVPTHCSSKYPEEFTNNFSQKDLSVFTEDLLWLKITTTSNLDEFINDVNITINTFPVINRKLKECFYRMKGITNIIPLETEIFESFLSVHTLKDSDNKKYFQIPPTEDHAGKTGAYAIRKSGSERMDTRSARDFLSYMSGLVRDESAAFASYGQDFVISLIKDLEKTLAQLEQRTRQHKTLSEDAPYYVVVDYNSHQESFFIRYWVNNSIHANGIYAGTRFSLYKGSEVRTDSLITIVNSHGGKQVPEPERHMDAYKFAILTHNKIVTTEDIKSFCRYELGERIENVQVKKGLLKSNKPEEGLVRCVEVTLEKKKSKEKSDEEDWERLIKSLESKLEQKSSLNLRYKVSLAEAN